MTNDLEFINLALADYFKGREYSINPRIINFTEPFDESTRVYYYGYMRPHIIETAVLSCDGNPMINSSLLSAYELYFFNGVTGDFDIDDIGGSGLTTPLTLQFIGYEINVK